MKICSNSTLKVISPKCTLLQYKQLGNVETLMYSTTSATHTLERRCRDRGVA
jgi:hypothetical protein